MATNTYVALKAQTLTSASPSITFSSIDQGYTDLVLIVSGSADSTAFDAWIRVGNGSVDTGSNYSITSLSGTGSGSGTSQRESNATYIHIDKQAAWRSGNRTMNRVNIMNYANTSTYKTILTRADAPADAVDVIVGLWRSTVAINTITVGNDGGVNFAAGSTFTLYGIRAEGVSPAPKATGGAIYSDSTYYYHVFGASGTFTPLSSLTADVLVVAGGGAGGGGSTAGNSGGGGAGGLLYFASQSLSATGYTCTVGAGGAVVAASNGSNGGDSQFGALTLVKGGGGGGYYDNSSKRDGLTGGSGGGASQYINGGTGGSATSGQGYAGASAVNTTIFSPNGSISGAGGGGSGAVGGTPPSAANPGVGGAGLSTYSSWGTATGVGENVSGTYYIAGGGGGSAHSSATTVGTGGSGGGGKGRFSSTVGTAGQANTGGGGGGGGENVSSSAGAGGSGFVIVRYLKA